MTLIEAGTARFDYLTAQGESESVNFARRPDSAPRKPFSGCD